MHLMHVHLNTGINCVLHEVQNQYMKEMLSKTFNRKQTTQIFSSKHF